MTLLWVFAVVAIYLVVVIFIAKAAHWGLDDMPRRPVQKLPPAKADRRKAIRGLSSAQQHEIYRRAAAQSRKE